MRNVILVLIILVGVSSCKSPEARRPVKQITGSFIKESAERNKELYQKEEKVLTAIMDADTLHNYIASEQGFWYYYKVKDTLSSTYPIKGNIVEFTYDIKDLNGNTVISEEENGVQVYKVDQSNQDLISGIREGIKLMKSGETVTFLLPSYKAYGYYGIENKLNTNIPVQSTVTLISIKQPLEN